MTENDRFIQAVNRLGLKQNQLAKEMNVSAQAINNIWKGKNKPSFDFISKFIEKYPQVNPRWLLTGTGEMFESESKLDPVQIQVGGKTYDKDEIIKLLARQVEILQNQLEGYQKAANDYLNKGKR